MIAYNELNYLKIKLIVYLLHNIYEIKTISLCYHWNIYISNHFCLFDSMLLLKTYSTTADKGLPILTLML